MNFKKAQPIHKEQNRPLEKNRHPLKQQIINFTLLLRPKQWTKNLLLFAALIFSYNVFRLPLVFEAVVAFFSFCLLSGCAYIINDILDIEKDRIHPRKKHRPLAAGKIQIAQAIIALAFLLPFSFVLAWSINILFFYTVLAYLCLTVSYSFWFKHIVILDIFSVAFGFLLRAVAGAAAINVNISPWFLICVFLLSLFIVLVKRRQELINLSDSSTKHRKVLKNYSVEYLDQLTSIVTASAIAGYSLYTFTASQSNLFMLTIPLVVYGIFRYLYLAHKKNMGQSPEEIILNDKATMINIIIWILLSIIILSLEQGGLF